MPTGSKMRKTHTHMHTQILMYILYASGRRGIIIVLLAYDLN